TMGQQFYVIRNNPTPGTPAAEAKKKRDALRHPQVAAEAEAETPAAKVAEEPVKPKPPQRAQPKKQSRKKRKRR
ncbi:MAG: membrane protein insertase YidC, partial [Nocardioidaceae bacterium]